jgi:N-acetylneuraminic acid mutarotase
LIVSRLERILQQHRHRILFAKAGLRAAVPWLLAGAVAAALTSCGGGGGGGGGSSSSETVGGSIAGLLSGGLVLSNGSSTVSPPAGATSFTFATALASGTAYTISVQTQPAGLTCTVSNASGTIGSSPVTNVAVVCPTPWVWQAGSTTAKAAGVYGSRGSAAAGNTPGARDGGATWADASGNLWLFGGYGYDSAGTLGYLSDFWEFTPSTGQWTWVSGSELQGAVSNFGALGVAAAANAPGARQGAAAWKDAAGDFWLFGGYQSNSAIPAGFLSDLWKYSVSTGLWTWVGGSESVNVPGVYGVQAVPAAGNLPGARAGSATWTDPAGNLWLFGGSEYDSVAGNNNGLNDLWKYSPATNQWTWVGGSQSYGVDGVYGSIGEAAASTLPGARDGAVSWVDASGDLWLFGGIGYDSKSTTAEDLNDLWKYTPATNEWTWESGSNVNSAVGVYGTLGTASGAAVPGARNGAVGWTDTSGNLWLIGGSGYDALGNGGALNDVWKFSPGSAQWTWVTGSSTQGSPGVYGTLGVSGANSPGGRAGASAWADGLGHYWLFGGIGLDSVATLADLDDLWEFTP